MALFFQTALIFIAQWSHFIFGLDKPTFDFHPPVKIDMVLAANFGELRKNHFHMGIDIKTNGKINLPLYSIDEGYVSRIKISPYGYGKVIYVNHPGGITSVYAHCNDFPAKIKSFIESTQLRTKQNEIDVYLTPDELIVEKGEHIAFSGNTGHSFGPHLHFELRDSHTEQALNPLLYGFKVKDDLAPVLRKIKIYGANERGELDGAQVEYSLVATNAGYTLPNIQLPSSFRNSKRIGIAVDGYDVYNGSANKLGLFGLTMNLDEQTVFKSELDKISFETSRYINTYSDPEMRRSRNYHKCFLNDFNQLEVYQLNSKGLLDWNDDQHHAIDITVSDVYGNERNVEFKIQWIRNESSSNFPEEGQLLHPDSTYFFSSEHGSLHIPKHLTYERIRNQVRFEAQKLYFPSEVNHVQTAYTVKLNPHPNLPIEKQYLALVEGRQSSNLYTYRDLGVLRAEVKDFGEIVVKEDQIEPEIQLLQKRTSISRNQSSLAFRISDRESGLIDYDVYVNGEWTIAYMGRGGRLTLSTSVLKPGINAITVTAEDQCKNIKKAEYSIRLL